MYDDEAPTVDQNSRCLSSVIGEHSWTEGENDDVCAWCGCIMAPLDPFRDSYLDDSVAEFEADKALRARPDGRMVDEVTYDERLENDE